MNTYKFIFELSRWSTMHTGGAIRDVILPLVVEGTNVIVGGHISDTKANTVHIGSPEPLDSDDIERIMKEVLALPWVQGATYQPAIL